MKRITSLFTLALVGALILATGVSALVGNGDFEAGTFGSWTKSAFINNGLSAARGAGGTDLSVIVGGAGVTPLSLSDANSGGAVRYPAYGNYSARVNSQLSYSSGGYARNANIITQDVAAYIDPVDNQAHLRFTYAAVMVEPGNAHSIEQRPHFRVRAINTSNGNDVLYDFSSYVNEPGKNWQNGAAFGSERWKYLDWNVIDLTPTPGHPVNAGDIVTFEVLAAGCSLGGHPGYVYVDEISDHEIAGPSIRASGPASLFPNSPITYTYAYRNGSTSTINPTIRATQPTGVTFTSVSDPTNCSLTAGTVTCNFSGMGAGADSTFTVGGTVTAAAGSLLAHGTYSIATPGFPTLSGQTVLTNVLIPPTTTSVVSSLNPAVYGQNVTFTATAASVSGTPTGTVQFVVDGVNFGSPLSLIGGSAQISTAVLGAGPHTVGANYSGSPGFPASNGLLSGGQIVNPAPLAVTASSQSVTYGDTPSVVSPQYLGFVLGQGPINLATQPTCSTTYAAGSPVAGSPYPTNCGGGIASNYNFVYTAGTVVATKKNLTVTANSLSRNYGSPNPIFTATFAGFVLGQTLATSGVTGSPTLTSVATPSSPSGGSPYSITVAIGSLLSSNYSFTMIDGILTINQALLTVTANNLSRVYGTANPAFTVTYSGYVNGEVFETSGVSGTPSLTTPATVTSPVGTHPINTANGTIISPNYSLAFVNGTLTITKAATTTAITNSAALAQSTPIEQAYPVNWITLPVAPSTGTMSGNVTVSDGAGATCTAPVAAGTCNLTSQTPGLKAIVATYPGDGNFTGSQSSEVSHRALIIIEGNVKQFVSSGTNTNLPGVTLALTGSETGETITDTSGNYSFGVTTLAGNYVVTPSGLDRTYDPISRTYTNVTARVSNVNFVAYTSDEPGVNPRGFRVANAVAVNGQPVVVPVTVSAQGNERVLAFSLDYNPALLGVPTVSCVSDCVSNTSFPGKIGLRITLPQPLTPGLSELATVTFTSSASGLSTTPVTFSDAPVARDVRDAIGNQLPALYLGGVVVAGIAPTPTPTPTPFPSPTPTSTPTPVPTPTSTPTPVPTPTVVPSPTVTPTPGPTPGPTPPRMIRAISVGAEPGELVTVPFVINATGNESLAAFTVNFNPQILSVPVVELGNGVPEGSILETNMNEVAAGRVGVRVDTANTYAVGTRQIVLITFSVAPNTPLGLTPITFGSSPTQQIVMNTSLVPLTTIFEPGYVQVGSTAAGVEVSGRVLTPDGRGLRNTRVTITDARGVTRTVTTGSFGHYQFVDVEVGSTYIVGVSSRRYRFSSRIVNVVDSLTDVDFVGHD